MKTERSKTPKRLLIWLLAALLTATLGLLSGCDDFLYYEVMAGAIPGSAGGPLSISPISATLPVDGSLVFTAGGGTAPYRFTVVSGNGDIDETTGRYTAPSSPGSDIVRVTDNDGATSDAQTYYVD
jgi:hypothetical protein